MKIIKNAVLILIITLGLLLSCTKDFKYDSIFDPEASVDPSLWKPLNLQLTLVNNSQIKLNWDKSTWHVDGYQISRKSDYGQWQEAFASVNANISEWIDTNAPIGHHYFYKVRAFAGSNMSDTIEQNYNFTLSAPTNLIIEPQSSTSVKLSWQDPNQFEQGFNISRKIGNGSWDDGFASVNTNVLEFIDNSINQNHFYEYKVRAFCQNHNSNYCMIIGYYPKVETPVFSLQSGAYSAIQTVSISCATQDALIRYTTDGSEPNTSSQIYTSAITINMTLTLKAKAFKTGFQESNTANAHYTINLPAIELLFPVGGETFHKGNTYSITWTTNSDNISNVTIHLYKGSSLWQAINNYASNTGSYQWTVFSQIQTGDDYYIQISNSDMIGYPNESDVSGYFSIIP